MPCTRVRLPGGGVAIVCGPRPRARRCQEPGCGEPAAFECDWKMGGGKTCDRRLCGRHAVEVAADKHLCPAHVDAFAAWKREREARRG